MPDWNLAYGGHRFDKGGHVTLATSGTTITNSTAGNNVKGSWQTVVASVPYNLNGFWADFIGTDVNGATRRAFVDLAVGDAGGGNETIVAENISFEANATLPSVIMSILVPVSVPAGKTIRARVQHASGGTLRGIIMSVRQFAGGFTLPSPFGRLTGYGINTATTVTTTVDPGGTADTVGAWAELVASTTYRIKQLQVIVGNNINTTMTDARYRLDIGVGAGGAERVLLDGLPFNATAVADVITPAVHGPFPVDIPAGSRLAARATCSIIDATDRLMYVSVMGAH